MDLIVRIGHALWGDRWMAPLSRAVRVSERTMRAWASGRRPVPSGVLRELAQLLAAHSAACRELAEEAARAAEEGSRSGAES